VVSERPLVIMLKRGESFLLFLTQPCASFCVHETDTLRESLLINGSERQTRGPDPKQISSRFMVTGL
jgi:hypothetical protein